MLARAKTAKTNKKKSESQTWLNAGQNISSGIKQKETNNQKNTIYCYDSKYKNK